MVYRVTEKTISGVHVHVSPGSAETLDRRGRICDVNKTTSLKTKTKTKTTIGKTKTKTKTTESKTKTKTTESKTEEAKTKTKAKTNVISADNVIINGKVAIIVSFYSTIFCMFSLFFHHNFLCVVCI